VIHKHVSVVSVAIAIAKAAQRATVSKHNLIPSLRRDGILEGRTGFDRVRKIMCARMCG
jgi:hypothetical protein